VDYQVLPLDSRIQALQEAFIGKVVDTVQDLPNVLYEVANESSGDTADAVQMPDGTSIPTPIGDSTDWQYWVITFLKLYERQMGYTPHPIGMTMQYPVPEQSKVNDVLFNSPADWISPGFDDVILGQPGANPFDGRWYNDPPPSDGTKVVISDTDHFAPGAGDALWAWKSFLRGHNPILMDFGIIDVVNPLDPSLGVPPYAAFEACRYAMGDTVRFARRLPLVDLEPRGDLTSTGFALANPGKSYLVLQPAADPFTVMLPDASYAVEWYSLEDRQTRDADTIVVAAETPVTFTSPFAPGGACVLYLQRTEL
jgi:hypothetical protein